MEDLILSQLKELLINKFSINQELLNDKLYNSFLTSSPFNFDAISLTYLFMEVESKFKIHIDTTQIMNYEFNTINSIVNIIKNNIDD